MSAQSKAQQHLMAMVHSAQQGEKPASKTIAKMAKDMNPDDVKDFASTKTSGLPDKVKQEQLVREIIRKVLREDITRRGDLRFSYGYKSTHPNLESVFREIKHYLDNNEMSYNTSELKRLTQELNIPVGKKVILSFNVGIDIGRPVKCTVAISHNQTDYDLKIQISH